MKNQNNGECTSQLRRRSVIAFWITIIVLCFGVVLGLVEESVLNGVSEEFKEIYWIIKTAYNNLWLLFVFLSVLALFYFIDAIQYITAKLRLSDFVVEENPLAVKILSLAYNGDQTFILGTFPYPTRPNNTCYLRRRNQIKINGNLLPYQDDVINLRVVDQLLKQGFIALETKVAQEKLYVLTKKGAEKAQELIQRNNDTENS